MQFVSVVASSADDVWRHASSLAGINRELWPVHMSGSADLILTDSLPTNTVVLRSRVTLFGVLLLDMHSLGLDAVWPGRGFHEHSHSWLQRSWEHVRVIEPTSAKSAKVIDQLTFEPRFAVHLVSSIVRTTFERRHRRLRQLFGDGT